MCFISYRKVTFSKIFTAWYSSSIWIYEHFRQFPVISHVHFVVKFLLLSFILDGITSAYEKVSPMMIFCQLMMLLEIVHAATGLVKGGVFSIVLQVSTETIHSTETLVYLPHSQVHSHDIESWE